MLKKLFYFGLGLASILYENFDELARTGEARYNQLLSADQPLEETVEIETEVSNKPVSAAVDQPAIVTAADDLTAVKGIGPTHSKRLQEAGITTYQALAMLTAEQIKEITPVADRQANEWIAEAQEME